MKDISIENLNKLIKLFILLVPIEFFFHYIETSLFINSSIFAFIVTFIYIILAGLISVKSKLFYIILIRILSILLSIVLGGMLITVPNMSWFNPFGINLAIIFTGIIILICILIFRFLSNNILK